MSNYVNNIPRDKGGAPLQEFPAPRTALVTTAAVTAISSVFTLNSATTHIEVSAPGTSAAIKWIGVGAAQTSVISSYFAAANFDHIVPSGTVRRFAVPQETQGISGVGVASSIFGLYQRMAAVPINGTAAASILVTEY